MKTKLCCFSLLMVFYNLFSFPSFAVVSTISLKQAIKSNAIVFNAISNGGAVGNCITFHMANTTCKTLKIKIDQALIFEPANKSFQNLVAVGGDSIQLEPDKTADIKLHTFCGKSYAMCPVKNMRYTLLKQGDSAMIRVMNYIRQHELYNYLGQHAVWTFTNDHCINTIYDPLNPEVSKKLLEYVANMRHMPLPKYYTLLDINNTPGAQMIDSGAGKSYVEMTWGNEGYRNMYVTVYKQNRDIYKRNVGNERCDATNHTFSMTFDPETERGIYYVELRDDHNKVWNRKEVYVGIDWCKIPR